MCNWSVIECPSNGVKKPAMGTNVVVPLKPYFVLAFVVSALRLLTPTSRSKIFTLYALSS